MWQPSSRAAMLYETITYDLVNKKRLLRCSACKPQQASFAGKVTCCNFPHTSHEMPCYQRHCSYQGVTHVLAESHGVEFLLVDGGILQSRSSAIQVGPVSRADFSSLVFQNISIEQSHRCAEDIWHSSFQTSLECRQLILWGWLCMEAVLQCHPHFGLVWVGLVPICQTSLKCRQLIL